MPNKFKLISKETGEPTSFTQIDEELCNLLDKEVHPERYVLGWYDAIGFSIAMGKELGSEELRETIKEYYPNTPEMLKMLDYLEDNYTSKAWYSHK